MVTDSFVEEQQFHWLVGILEGEGTFLGPSPSRPNTPTVRVMMTDRDIVERVAALWDRAVIKIPPRQAEYKPAFATTVKGAFAVSLMVRLRPTLGLSRQAQIDRALANWGGSRNRWSYAGVICAVGDCGLEARTQRLCRRHHNLWYKAITRGHPTTIAPRPLSAADFLKPTSEPWACTSGCEVTWLAGLLEGEGWFGRTCTDGRCYPGISLEMCALDVVQRACRILGAPRVLPQRPRDPSWDVTYKVAISGGEAAAWMTTLRPLMGMRRGAAIDAALASYDPIRLTDPPAVCVVAGCDDPHRSRGLCHKHYMMWSRDVALGRAPRITPVR